jgi:hypothetical protein
LQTKHACAAQQRLCLQSAASNPSGKVLQGRVPHSHFRVWNRNACRSDLCVCNSSKGPAEAKPPSADHPAIPNPNPALVGPWQDSNNWCSLLKQVPGWTHRHSSAAACIAQSFSPSSRSLLFAAAGLLQQQPTNKGPGKPSWPTDD